MRAASVNAASTNVTLPASDVGRWAHTAVAALERRRQADWSAARHGPYFSCTMSSAITGSLLDAEAIH